MNTTSTLTLFLLILSLPFYNLSQEIQIGDQIWQQKNLNVSFFQNGDSIPRAKTAEEWQEASQNKQPAWCYFNNDASSAETKGKLYNFYALSDERRLAPKGWKVPEYDDFIKLLKYYFEFMKHETLEGKELVDTRKMIEKLKKDFKNTQSDSMFVNKNSDSFERYIPLRNVVPLRSDYSFPLRLSDGAIKKIENEKLGTVIEIKEDDQRISLFKIVDFMPIEYGSMKYLLLGKKSYPNQEKAKELADSILKVIQKEDNFAEMITIFSDDYASVDRGGVYKDFDLAYDTVVNPIGGYKNCILGTISLFERLFYNGAKNLSQVEKVNGFGRIKILDKLKTHGLKTHLNVIEKYAILAIAYNDPIEGITNTALKLFVSAINQHNLFLLAKAVHKSVSNSKNKVKTFLRRNISATNYVKDYYKNVHYNIETEMNRIDDDKNLE